MNQPSRHRGYVLILTMGLLVLASTLLVGVGRASVNHALAARTAADELQRRWAIASCRTLVLPTIEQILRTQETQRKQPTASARTTIRLGGLALELTVADEQAKANVNQLLVRENISDAQTRLREALVGSGVAAKVRLRPLFAAEGAPTTGPTTAAATTQPARQLIGGFGQVFDDLPPDLLLGGRNAPAQSLTCWGGGKINIRRAPVAALTLALDGQLSGAEMTQLLEARDAYWTEQARAKSTPSTLPTTAPATTQAATLVDRLLAQANIDPQRGLPLTDTSMSHSLWIVASDGRRQWQYLMVLDHSDEKTIVRSFVW
jgi:type II secretory pathway component PulK